MLDGRGKTLDGGGAGVDTKLQPNRVKGVGKKRPRASGKMGGVDN